MWVTFKTIDYDPLGQWSANSGSSRVRLYHKSISTTLGRAGCQTYWRSLNNGSIKQIGSQKKSYSFQLMSKIGSDRDSFVY